MNLKNYTTEVPASRSIEAIEKLLFEFGATNVMKTAEAGKVRSISFIVDVDGHKLPFRLPGKVKEAFTWLRRKKPNSKDETILAQAERMVWKQLHEWVHLQLSQIELSQMERLEAFFPYLYDVQSEETYFERVKKGGLQNLLPHS